MARIENRTFDELQPGDSASLVRQLTYKDIEVFAIMSGDVNPSHVDEAYAKSDMFHGVVAHGMWGAALISTVLGTELPGPGTIYVSQSLNFLRSVVPGDTMTVSATVLSKNTGNHHVTLECRASNQRGEEVIAGTAEVLAPIEKISRERAILPELQLRRTGRRYERLIEMTRGLAPLRTAVVHPVDSVSLLGAIEAARLSLIVPVLVGPEQKIRAAAQQARLDLSGYEIVTTEHSDAAAAMAVAMARAGKVEALMKGALHTDELHAAVVDPTARSAHSAAHQPRLRDRRAGISAPAVHHRCGGQCLSGLEEKRDIVQNAIDLAHALGIANPRVAILSAVETVSAKIRSTLDAAALCKMADRGQITGGILDGPLAFDNAVSEEAARDQGHRLAGRRPAPTSCVVPDLESGNMLAKQLEYLADAQIAGIVLGARVPIILTSRADKTIARLGSCAIALLLARHRAAVTS